MRSKTVCSRHYTRTQRRSGIMCFRRIRGVKRRVFAENMERNGVFSEIMWYSRKFNYVQGFNRLNKIFEVLGLGLVFYWNDAKKCDKRTIIFCACVPVRTVFFCVRNRRKKVSNYSRTSKRYLWFTVFLYEEHRISNTAQSVIERNSIKPGVTDFIACNTVTKIEIFCKL
jgi:hypothetical protein